MKRILITFSVCFLLFLSLYAQYDTSQLAGMWVLQSVKFKHSVDLNKDGFRSSDAFWEFDECHKDQQLELLPDFNAKTYMGTGKTGCANEVKRYKRNVKEELVKEVKYEMGKRVIDEHRPTVLKLVNANGTDQKVFVVIGVDENLLTLKGVVRLAPNSTEEAILIYRKRKK
jgi:hypothetical protein